jgi:SAM-dependent methyltransferase
VHGPDREATGAALARLSRPLPDGFRTPLAGARALEIGGPSEVFSGGGLLPVYPLLRSIDGVQWATDTAWHTLDRERGYCPEGPRRGELHVFDDVDLAALGDATYDLVLSSHVIEHIANPLRALAAWRRVTRPGGHLLLIVPHMAGTFDHRRPLTTLEHMIDDEARRTSEDDLTHLQETLRLHDRNRDAEDVEQAVWEQRRRENPSRRLLHHHTFTTRSLMRLLDRAGLQLLAAETRFPHDIYVLGRWPGAGERAENAAFIAARRPSPFRVDRGPRRPHNARQQRDFSGEARIAAIRALLSSVAARSRGRRAG